MQKIYIKYNPYRVETEVLIGDNKPKKNSRLYFGDIRLQEWVESLPYILSDECSTNNFEIIFTGTQSDYEDIIVSAERAKSDGININIEHIPVKDVEDKENDIRDILKMIKEGPFEELKRTDVVRTLELANISDIKVDVISAMSAEKSTLINALLHRKLIPAKKEDNLSIITEIKHNEEKFELKAYDKEKNLIGTYENLTDSIIREIYSNKQISRIKIESSIPFIKSDDISLELFDITNTKNMSNGECKLLIDRIVSELSNDIVLYIINAAYLEVYDENSLLNYVVEKMNVEGKQFRDRFIFVVDKLDELSSANDNSIERLQKVKEYLVDKGIENPNIYPISADLALYIRTITMEETINKNFNYDVEIKKINTCSKKHFEKYAPLPVSVKKGIQNKLQKAIDDKDEKEQALIHTGIVSLEEAIRLYTRKYVKTAKIKNIMEIYNNKIESKKKLEIIKQQIFENEERKKEIIEKIGTIEAKFEAKEEFEKLKVQIDKINYYDEVCDRVANIQKRVNNKIIEYSADKNEKLTADEAIKLLKTIEIFVERLQIDVQVELEILVSNIVQEYISRILEKCQENLCSLVDKVNFDNFKKMEFDMKFAEIDNIYKKIIDCKEKQEEVLSDNNSNYLKNTRSILLYRNHEDYFYPLFGAREPVRKCIDGECLYAEVFEIVKNTIILNCMSVKEYIKEEEKNIKSYFYGKYDDIYISHEKIQDKLYELNECKAKKKYIDEKLAKLEYELWWCKYIDSKLDLILEI